MLALWRDENGKLLRQETGNRLMIKIILFLGILTLPISYDYTFATPQLEHSGWAGGFTITFSDLVFLLLFVLWRIRTVGSIQPEREDLYKLPIIIFLVACLLSVLGAFWRIYCYFQIFQYCKIVFLYYYVPLMVLRSKEDLLFVCYSLLALLLFQSSFAVIQFTSQDFYNFLRTGSAVRPTFFGDYIRSQGTVGSPNGLAALLLPLLLLAQMMFMNTRQIAYKFLYGCLFILGTTALVLTFSRMAWVTFLIGFVLCSYFRRRKVRLSAQIITFATLTIVVAVCSEFVSARITTDDQGSAMDRWYLMQIAWNIIKNNFLTGIGINNYWFVMNNYVPANYDWPFIYIVHNVFLLIFAETGILGFIAVSLLLVMPIFKTIRVVRTKDPLLSILSFWLCVSFAAMIILNMVDLTWASQSGISLYFLLLALSNVIINLNRRCQEP